MWLWRKRSLKARSLWSSRQRCPVLRHFPTPAPFIDLPLDEFSPVEMFGRQSVMGRAKESKESLIVTAKDGKRPLVVHLKAGPRPTSPPIIAFEFTLVVPTGVDPLAGLGRNVSRPGRLVFHSRHARLDISRHLVQTRSGFSSGLLPRLPPLELSLWIFFSRAMSRACSNIFAICF